jgi:hypothetical protein
MRESTGNEFDPRHVLPILPDLFPIKMVKHDCVVPMEVDADGCLIVAAVKPCSEEVIGKAQFVSNRQVKVVLVSEESIAYAIQRCVTYYKPPFSGPFTREELNWWLEEEF